TRRLTGIAGGTEFLLVRAADDEHALETEETLAPRLAAAKADGALGGYQTLAQVIPSAARQRADRALVEDKLIQPFLADYYAQLGFAERSLAPEPERGVLTPAAIPADSPLSFLRSLVLEDDAQGAMHLVLLSGVARLDEVRRVSEAVPGVRLVDPAGDITRLLGEYRRRAMLLLGVSTLFMLPIIFWRYGLSGGARTLAPPAIAVLLTPPLMALYGIPFTFFSAMALILVLSIGFDYAVFCRETSPTQRAVTMLGVWLAMVTTLLSFGLLAFSRVFAVQAFGTTLLIGTLLAFLVSPLAGDSNSFHGKMAEKD
ncbi:MAG TPA: hypothetical protein VJ747_06205, partial [Stellaceae bacterium]|nr:hypothetical protein [Stellaceae bacterium]